MCSLSECYLHLHGIVILIHIVQWIDSTNQVVRIQTIHGLVLERLIDQTIVFIYVSSHVAHILLTF